jgi:hypothetical protein
LKHLRARGGSLKASKVNSAHSKAIFSNAVMSGSSSTYRIFLLFLLLVNDNRDVTDAVYI